MRDALGLWRGLIRVCDNGSLAVDSDPGENQIRSIAPTRQTAAVAGNDTGAESRSRLGAFVATFKRSGVRPVGARATTLCAILDSHPRCRIEDLAPCRAD